MGVLNYIYLIILIITAFIPISILLYNRYVIQKKPSKLIPVNPINEMGSNIFIMTRKSLTPTSTEDFKIMVNIYLTPRFEMTIAKIDMDCDVNAIPKGNIKGTVNGNILDNDKPYIAENGKAIKIRLSKEFSCNFASADKYIDGRNSDVYGPIFIRFYLASKKWSGIKIVKIFSELLPGGHLRITKYEYV